MNVLILGVNGFIGSHLCEAILNKTDWHVYGLDLHDEYIKNHLTHPRFHFHCADMTQDQAWIEKQIEHCDVVLPLVAIATPALYVQDPLRVFALDFEANLQIVRQCVALKTRLIFPSTSEVYGMCTDHAFDEEESALVTGPIHKERWIYATSKQLLDRLIYAYGKHHQLSYTLFRPFNWYGPKLDDVHNAKPGGSRVLTQFIGNILRGEAIHLVNGGLQKRCFTYIDDGIDALLRIIENKNNVAHQAIFNIGNPTANLSIRELAQALIDLVRQHFPQHQEQAKKVKLISVAAEQYYGKGYQDIELRVPAIERAQKALGWTPYTDALTGLSKTAAYYFS